MAIILGENRYGKLENRVFRVTRHGDTHEILDLNVSVQLSGDFAQCHLQGDNSKVLATDSQKNTVFALSQKHGAMEPEAFGLLLARHFIESHAPVTAVEVCLEKFDWDRITARGKPHPRAFRRNGSLTRVATVRAQRAGEKIHAHITSGIEGLVILKTSDSEFKGFMRDAFCTLPQTTDRILATELRARWRWNAIDSAALEKIDWEKSHRDTLDTLLCTFAEHHSLSLQHTLYAMGEAVLEQQTNIGAIRVSLPNKHHFLVDLAAFGQDNSNEVYIAADRPYGCIEAVVTRDDAPPPPETWPNW